MKDIHVRVPLNRAAFKAFVPEHVKLYGSYLRAGPLCTNELTVNSRKLIDGGLALAAMPYFSVAQRKSDGTSASAALHSIESFRLILSCVQDAPHGGRL